MRLANALRNTSLCVGRHKHLSFDSLVYIASVVWLIIFSFLIAFFVFPPPAGLIKKAAHFGLVISVFSAFYGTFSFSVNESRNSPRWLSSLSFSLLCASALLSLAAMARKFTPLLDAGLVHLGLSLYIVWDLTAASYYKKTSKSAYDSYRELLAIDLLLFLVFFLIYIPSSTGLWQLLPGSPELAERGQVSVAIKAMILWGELLIVLLYMPKHSKTKDRVLTVSEGYKKWSYNYGLDSNAIIYVENRHTMERLDDIQNSSIILGNHLDFGCGTGRCLSLFLDKVDKIIAVDQSPEMLSKCKESYSDHGIIEFQQGGLASLRRIPENSLQSTVCCLVLDHLNSDDLYDFFAIVHSKLKVGGWLYITDVNPEFSRLKQPFAKFIDNAGFVCRIEVYPHSQGEVAKAMKSAGFKKFEFGEELIIDDDLLKWPELEGLVGFPLIVEYYAEKH